MDMNWINEERKEQEANRMAMDVMLSIFEAIAPDDMQPMVQLPKLCHAINKDMSAILRLVSDTVGFEKSVKLASEANELLERVYEAMDAFIDQHKEGGLSE